MVHTLVIQVTNRCNLRCPYCYVRFNDKTITIDDVKAQVELAPRVSKLMDPNFNGEYTVSYFGGEPLLGFDVVCEVDDWLVGSEKTSTLQTNSMLLTEEIKAELDRRRISWGYSYDGLCDTPESFEVHEAQLTSGLIGRKAKTMVSSQNASRLIDNYRYFVGRGWTCPDLTLVKDDSWTEEGVAAAKAGITDVVDLAVELTRKTGTCYCAGFLRLHVHEMVVGRVCGKRDFHCFAGRYGMVLTPERVIYPCTRFYGAGAYPLADANTGEVYGKTIDKLRRALDTTRSPKCRACAIGNYCNGACAFPSLTRGGGEFMDPPEGFCELWRHVHVETIRYCEALRDVPAFKDFVEKTLTTRR